MLAVAYVCNLVPSMVEMVGRRTAVRSFAQDAAQAGPIDHAKYFARTKTLGGM